jgi:hypothetical protein
MFSLVLPGVYLPDLGIESLSPVEVCPSLLGVAARVLDTLTPWT